jgi:hypothetical protein
MGADEFSCDGVYVKTFGRKRCFQSVKDEADALTLAPERLGQLRGHGDRVQILGTRAELACG